MKFYRFARCQQSQIRLDGFTMDLCMLINALAGSRFLWFHGLIEFGHGHRRY
jgi:hypothetical protein